MRCHHCVLPLLASVSLIASPTLAQEIASAPRPPALQMEDVPQVPVELAQRVRPYLEYRTASFQGWNPLDKSMLITTRFGNTAQLHSVKGPGGQRSQISFENEPVTGNWSPKGDLLLVEKDTGGSEFYQLYALKDGRLTLLTDGKSRNNFNAWSKDGTLIGYSSTRRNGKDSDLYVMNPRDPKSDRLVAQLEGGGWAISSFAPDGKSALVAQSLSISKTNLFRLDLASGQMTPIGDHKKEIAYGAAKYGADGTIWVTSDEGSDFQRLGTLYPTSGAFMPAGPSCQCDVEEFAIASDGKTLAYTINDKGVSSLFVQRNQGSGTPADIVSGFPKGVISHLDISSWGEVGFTLSSARVPGDAYSGIRSPAGCLGCAQGRNAGVGFDCPE